MNNHDCVVAVLTHHREMRHWDDGSVATDLLAQLGLDPEGNAAHATALVDPALLTEDEVKAVEAEAKKLGAKAVALREALDRQNAPEDAKAKAEPHEPTRAEARAAHQAETKRR